MYAPFSYTFPLGGYENRLCRSNWSYVFRCVASAAHFFDLRRKDNNEKETRSFAGSHAVFSDVA